MARKRTKTDTGVDYDDFNDDTLLLDLDDLDQDEQDCLSALSVHDQRFHRDQHEDY